MAFWDDDGVFGPAHYDEEEKILWLSYRLSAVPSILTMLEGDGTTKVI